MNGLAARESIDQGKGQFTWSQRLVDLPTIREPDAVNFNGDLVMAVLVVSSMDYNVVPLILEAGFHLAFGWWRRSTMDAWRWRDRDQWQAKRSSVAVPSALDGIARDSGFLRWREQGGAAWTADLAADFPGSL